MFPKLSIGEHAFGFRGEVGPYIGMNVGGILLTMITLGIYMPWYMKRIISYLAGEPRSMAQALRSRASRASF